MNTTDLYRAIKSVATEATEAQKNAFYNIKEYWVLSSFSNSSTQNCVSVASVAIKNAIKKYCHRMHRGTEKCMV